MTAYSSILTDYLGEGLAAARPATLSIAPTALGLYYATDTKAFSAWNSATVTWDVAGGGAGSVTDVVAGAGLKVGAGPGGTITTSGTLNVIPATTAALGGVLVGRGLSIGGTGTLSIPIIAAGVISSNGTVAVATTLGAGIGWSSSTLSNTGVVQFGTDTGTISVQVPLYEVSSTLSLRTGVGLAVGSGTLFNSGVVAVGGDKGSIIVGTGLLESGNTLSNAGILALSGETGSIIIAGGLAITAGTLFNDGVRTIGGTQGDIILGTNLSLSGHTLNATGGAGGVTSVVAGTGLGGGTITTSGTLTNAGVIAIGATAGSIVLGPNLSMTGQTLEVSAPGTGTVTSIVAGTGLAGGTITGAGTLTNAGVLHFGGVTGDVSLGANLSMTGQTLEVSAPGTGTVTSVVAGLGLAGGTISAAGTITLDVATTAALGGVIAGSGVTINPGGTISVAPGGVTSIGGDTGSIVVGAGLLASSNTLSNTGVLQFGTDAGTITVGTGLTEASGTLSLNAATTAALGGVIVGTGLTISAGTISNTGTGSGGTVTSVVAGTGLSGGTITTSGTIAFATIAAGDFLANTGTVTAVPTATAMGTLTAGTGLSGGPFTPASGGTIANAGVLAVGATAGSIVLGAHLAMTGSTLDTTGYGTMAVQNSNSVSITGGTITGMPTPSASTDVANKAYVDAAIVGIDFKPTAIVATTTALPSNTYLTGTIALIGTGATTIDGHVLVINDIVLVKNEGTASHNGLYNVTTAGTTGIATVLIRNASMNQSSELAGAFVPVDNVGTVNANSLWISNPTTPATIDVTAIPFTQLNAPTSFVQGAGISISSNTISNAGVIQFGTDTGTIVVSTGLQEASNTLTLKAATTAALGGIVAGSGVTIGAGGTISVAAPGTGTVTSIIAGAGLGGGTITGAGTITNAGLIEFLSGTVATTGTVTIGTGLALSSNTLSATASSPSFSDTISAAGTVQGTATTITSNINVVTVAAANSGVRLMLTPTPGFTQQVFDRGANNLNVYPASGATIETLGANVAAVVVAGGVATFTAQTTTQWLAS